MCLVCLPLGIGLIVAVLIDLLWTTLWVDGGSGPLAARLATGFWRLLAKGGGLARSIAGPIILVSTLAMWVVGVWTGWTLVFASGESPLMPSHPGIDHDLPGTIYFVAYSMFASGNGDFLPSSATWQLATSVMIATGILLVTLGIPYVLSVIGAVPDKRSFASGVEGLGMEATEFVVAGWNGEGFDGLYPRMSSLAGQLDRLAQDHLAYPVLHYYHTRADEHASSAALATFDEALTILRFGVQADRRPDQAILASARAASRNYLNTVEHAFDIPVEDPPPPPSLEPLRDAGIPTVSDEAFAEALAELGDHRQQLWGLVEADARSWPGREP